MNKPLSKESIIQLLKTNDTAVARALVALNKRQTNDEQQAQDTRYNNGRGFRPCHARMGTSMAQYYIKWGRLSEKQIAYWRKPMRDGKMRIEIYAGQLLEVAKAKAMQTQLPLAPKKPVDPYQGRISGYELRKAFRSDCE